LTTLDFPDSIKAIWPLLFLAAVRVPEEKATLALPLTVHITVFLRKAKLSSKVWGGKWDLPVPPSPAKRFDRFCWGRKNIIGLESCCIQSSPN
jgi:hypothetical protein